MKCRNCKTEMNISFVDLGTSPPSNSYLNADQLQSPELFYPLRVKVCDACWLVQTEDFAKREVFFTPDYAYFSSFSNTWLTHAENYVSKMVSGFSLNSKSFVVEIASNDGYLLQYVHKLGIPCLGIEPTESTAEVAIKKGIQTLKEFFGTKLAVSLVRENRQADLVIANNVLAHVPDVNDFLTGIFALLKDDGIATFEFPHLLQLVNRVQFDTIYHEHYSYLSLISVRNIFEINGLEVFDVEELSTHGGSLRIFAQKSKKGLRNASEHVFHLLEKEKQAGLDQKEFYEGFQSKINKTKDKLLQFLIKAKENGFPVAGYGAAAKGNTFLNYAGIRSDLVEYVVDKNPYKQNKFLPGSRIPIVNEETIRKTKPRYIIIFPWNLKDEISEQLSYIREWGGEFVVAIPELEIF